MLQVLFDSVSFTVDSTFDSYILNIDEATSNNCVDISLSSPLQ